MKITKEEKIVNDCADADITCTAVLPEQANEELAKEEKFNIADEIEPQM